MTVIPYGYCKCGCGRKTNIPTINNRSCGYFAGVPMQFVSGHNAKGKKPSISTRNKLRLQKLGHKNPMYGKPMSEKNKQALLKSNKDNKWMCGKKLPQETRDKMSISRKGEKHWNWRGGITPKNLLIRRSSEYFLWRRAVFERDGYRCIWCNSSEKIEADHIKPFAFFPELRLAIDNGRTLCHRCHNTTKVAYKKMCEIYGDRL